MILEIKTSKAQEIVDITKKIEDFIKENLFINGIVFLYCPHTTCAISINEGADSTVKKDIINKLNEIIDPGGDYLHMEGNSHAHIKSVLTGNNVFVFVENGKLVLGRWQSIYLIEYDGPRNREIFVKFFKEV